LNEFKIKNKRLLIYRRVLCCLLVLGIIGTLAVGYFFLQNKIPSTIMLKAGVEQELDFQVPASGELYKEVVEVSGKAATEDKTLNTIYVDFARPVTVKAGNIDVYKLDLKLFGIIPLKEVDVEVIRDVKLKPAGIPIGIYVKTEGVLVVGIGDFEGEEGQKYSPGKYILQTGDYILEVNDEKVDTKKELISLVEHCEGQELVLKIKRGELELAVKVKPELNHNGEYKLGVWVRDNAQGVGTMTYVDEQGRFGALGHGINDVDTSTIMSLEKGTLYHTEIIGITKGSNGSPGELTGFIEYDDDNVMGDITANTIKGIFGVCKESTAEDIEGSYLPIGLKQEIETGPAKILCSLGEEVKTYEIEITDIDLENDNVNRGIILKITDEELLEATGGIVQGMSGSPIIQDGKIVGAVTHVLVNDPTRGYGIFIENMLDAAK